MPTWLRRWVARIPRWVSRLAFAEWIWRGISTAAILGVGLWTAARAWVEGVIAPYGTLGYVGVALCVALALTLVLMGVAWAVDRWRGHRIDGRRTAPARADSAEQTAALTLADEEAQHDLTLFVTDYVLPVCFAQLDLQESIIRNSYVNEELANLAIQNTMSSCNVREFGEHFEYFRAKFCGSPTEQVPLNELKKRVLAMDKNYEALCDQAWRLATAAGWDCRTYPALVPRWQEWRARHNDLVKAYRNIKRDRRFAPELYRPGIGGPWTEEIQ